MQELEDIRGISDEFAADGNAVSSFGLSNMVWGFGQFLGAHSANRLPLIRCATSHLSQQPDTVHHTD